MKNSTPTWLGLLAMLCILVSSPVFSQSLFKVSIETKIQRSTLIAEGKVIDQHSFWNAGHTMIYTSNTIELYKVFKGNSSKSTIEVLTVGGSVDNYAIIASELAELSIGDIGVYFLRPNTINLRSPQSGELLFDLYSSSQGFFKYFLASQTASAPFVRYTNIASGLYTELVSRNARGFENKKPTFDVTDFALNPNNPNAPVISNFAPTSVNAGAVSDAANNLLTINGTGFTAGGGSAGVYFDDANDGTGGNFIFLPFNHPLVVSWSDTQIQVRVPSSAGTGGIAVQDNAGLPSSLTTDLNVRFAVLTAIFSGNNVKEGNLMDFNTNGGYSVFYSTETANSGINFDTDPAKATFQRALNTWQEVSGLNVIEGGTTANQVVNPADFNNTVMYDNTATTVAPLADGVLGVCYSSYALCNPVAANASQKRGFDIVIRQDGVSEGTADFEIGPCHPDAIPETDLETVILHEIGHGLELGHINDSYEGSFLPNINPGKLMNFAIVNNSKRTSPDWSAKIGAAYTIAQQGNTYGGPCGLATAEMTPLSTTAEAKDECPGSFPGTTTSSGSVVVFDLVHATSNKNVDPQFTGITCDASGTGITNTAYYAFRTNAAGGTLSLSVSGYGTTPASQSSCLGAGVELAIYQVGSCPTAQAFPAPIACRTFNANGALTNITGLSASTNYLLLVDGIDNTKANFSLTFTGAALPISFSSFTGEVFNSYNRLHWGIEMAYDVKKLYLEKSSDGVQFERLAEVTSSIRSRSGQFDDYRTFSGENYYRLAVENLDGSKEYSKIVVLRRKDAVTVNVFPNPANQILNIEISAPIKGRYTIKLHNAYGQMVANKVVMLNGSRQITELPVSRLSAGLYHVSVYDASQKLIRTSAITIK